MRSLRKSDASTNTNRKARKAHELKSPRAARDSRSVEALENSTNNLRTVIF